MQFVDLQKQYHRLQGGIDQGIREVLEGSDFIMGKKVKQLEKELADYVGIEHCITCGNGTDALLLSLMAYGVKEGDAVFLPTFTFFATAEVVSICGATPIFVDIDPDTFNISTEDLTTAIEEVKKQNKLNPRAIIAVDLFGLPYDAKLVNAIAEEHNLLVVEDAAQGFGASYNGKRAGTLGDIATTSFFPSKPLGCYGDGGAVFTSELKVKEHIESLKIHGKGKDKYDNVQIGMNSRLDTIQAAILLCKLDAFRECELESRIRAARYYDEGLKDIAKIPFIPNGCVSSYAQYSVLFETEKQRNHIRAALSAQNIPTMIYYERSMHQQTAFRNNPSIYRRFDNADKVSKTILNLPMHSDLDEDTIAGVCTAIKNSI